ncbi:murein biosynthesis integral membrane protein MurJ [Niveibacterium microcysteis]|uniref:Lipid II flippase MurJ n=1 Tax=Niveibacterium microcysteis TaxID=2811415 RepID=A0ABX7MBF9_9RHOO|nr:lipid II flippase MurJ [Niveibacterium microcysteis]QSI79031.1 hypothetical protein JY500_10630 [Niveibacterium microcysteis]
MARNVFSIAIGNLASKGLGIVRELLFAASFGTGDTAAAFRIAQTGFQLPSQALVGDALSAGLLPLYRKLSAESKDSARVLVLVACFYGLIFSAVVTILLYLYSESAARFIAPAVEPSVLAVASGLLKVLALATPFYVLSGTISFVEASFGSFGAIAWRPVLLNVGSIAGVGLAVLFHVDHWLATAILISHVLFFMWTVLELRRLDRLMPEGPIAVTVVRQIGSRFARNMLPLLGLPLIAQVNVLVERIVSSWIGTSVIPSVDYSRFIADTTVQLIAMPLGVLTMSKHGGVDTKEARTHIRDVSATIVLIAFPLAVIISQNAEDIIRTLFARGAFNEQSISSTADVLRWMGGALGMTITAYYLVKALNSQLRNVEALMITIAACSANMLVNVLLWRSYGAQTVGMAVASYSMVLFTLSFTRLHLWRELGPFLAVVVGCCFVQFVLTRYLAEGLAYPYGLIASCVATLVLWGVLSIVVPPLRTAARPVLCRIPVIKSVFR